MQTLRRMTRWLALSGCLIFTTSCAAKPQVVVLPSDRELKAGYQCDSDVNGQGVHCTRAIGWDLISRGWLRELMMDLEACSNKP